VLTVNKLDRCFSELIMGGEEAYCNLRRVIEKVNSHIATYDDERLGDTQVDPAKGSVSFSAGLHGWAFTLTTFANIYAAKTGKDPEYWMNKLWDDNFYDPASKKWYKVNDSSGTRIRGFVYLIYERIKVVIESALGDQKTKLFKELNNFGVTDKLKAEDKEKNWQRAYETCYASLDSCSYGFARDGGVPLAISSSGTEISLRSALRWTSG
jgi:elongation factor 2